MITKILSQSALDTIDKYLHFKVGKAECSVPYFNNKRKMRRAGFRANVGKGSPKEILDEVEILGLKEKVKTDKWTNDFLKRFMCDNNIGIDCSGLAYYVLAAENKSRGSSQLGGHLTFPLNKGLRSLISKIRPVENTDVLTFAHPDNSSGVDLKNAEPGDFITMTGADSERNHILIIHEVDIEGSVPISIRYTHSVAWPEDGQYEHGVRQGRIDIIDSTKSLLEQNWIEKEKTGSENPTRSRALISKTEIRRLKWWK